MISRGQLDDSLFLLQNSDQDQNIKYTDLSYGNTQLLGIENSTTIIGRL